jgi:hypothetical protein
MKLQQRLLVSSLALCLVAAVAPADARGGGGSGQGGLRGQGGQHGFGGHRGGGHSAYGGHRSYGGHGHGYGASPWFWGVLGLGVGLSAYSHYNSPYYNSPYYNAPYYNAPVYAGDVYYYDPTPPLVETPPAAAAPAPQAQAAATQPATAVEPVIYPRNGQNAAQLDADRQQCAGWAAAQPRALADAGIYQRAVWACMDGRGYTLR